VPVSFPPAGSLPSRRSRSSSLRLSSGLFFSSLFPRLELTLQCLQCLHRSLRTPHALRPGFRRSLDCCLRFGRVDAGKCCRIVRSLLLFPLPWPSRHRLSIVCLFRPFLPVLTLLPTEPFYKASPSLSTSFPSKPPSLSSSRLSIRSEQQREPSSPLSTVLTLSSVSRPARFRTRLRLENTRASSLFFFLSRRFFPRPLLIELDRVLTTSTSMQLRQRLLLLHRHQIPRRPLGHLLHPHRPLPTQLTPHPLRTRPSPHRRPDKRFPWRCEGGGSGGEERLDVEAK
jgi:hypothetical protein